MDISIEVKEKKFVMSIRSMNLSLLSTPINALLHIISKMGRWMDYTMKPIMNPGFYGSINGLRLNESMI